MVSARYSTFLSYVVDWGSTLSRGRGTNKTISHCKSPFAWTFGLSPHLRVHFPAADSPGYAASHPTPLKDLLGGSLNLPTHLGLRHCTASRAIKQFLLKTMLRSPNLQHCTRKRTLSQKIYYERHQAWEATNRRHSRSMEPFQIDHYPWIARYCSGLRSICKPPQVTNSLDLIESRIRRQELSGQR